MEYELEEVERDYIEFRREMGEYNIEIAKSSIYMVMIDTITSLQLKRELTYFNFVELIVFEVHNSGNMSFVFYYIHIYL